MTETGSTALDRVPPTRRAILMTLKRRGEARAEELAEDLGITVSAIRQHLTGLADEGLVGHRQERHGPGRPRHLYHLGDGAEGLFPKAYGELTNELLNYVGDEDPELIDRVFERRRQRRVDAANERLAGHSFDERVVELARILDEDGYLAEAVRDEEVGWRIIEHNCAILTVALRYGVACGSELDFLREVMPDAEIERISHMVAGAHHCAYRVTEVAPATGARKRRPSAERA